MRDFIPLNSSMIAITADNHTSITIFGTLKCFHVQIIFSPPGYESYVDSSSYEEHFVPDVKRSDIEI